MDALSNLMMGLAVALTWNNLLYAFLGALIGTLVGVLPGLGPLATMAMLLPTVYLLDATPALIMLAGIYYGAQYGGSTTAILINIPGESSAVVTAIDGYQMARQGRAGTALATAALGSFFAGCVATIVIAFFAEPLSHMALKFGAREYFSLMILGLVGSVALASGSMLKAVCMVLLGLLLGQIDTDLISGTERFTMGIDELSDGINFVVLAMGLFGLGEIISNLGKPAEEREVFTSKVKGLWLSKDDFKKAWPASVRGTALGSALGILPGAGAVLASFSAYALEKKVARDPSQFGHGDIRGVAGPESANNAAAQTSFIPMLSLGLPSGAIMALMIGAMIIKGIQPGPQVMTSNPSLFWGFVASMWVGNLMLVILNLPLIGIWIKLLTVPYRLLFPAILCFCCIGLYTLNNNNFDIYSAVFFGAAGYICHKLRCEAAPLLLGFVLGPMIEENLRRALLLSSGDWATFVSSPISTTMLLLSAGLIIAVAVPALSRRRAAAFQED